MFYLLCRRDAWLTVLADRCFGIHLCAALPEQLPEDIRLFINGAGADMLWAYALTFSCAAVLGCRRKQRKTICVLCILFGAAMELLQAAGIMRGTGDPLDVFCEGAAVLAALYVIARYEKKSRGTGEI